MSDSTGAKGSFFGSLLVFLVGLVAGVIVDFALVAGYVRMTYACQDGPPCDAGAMTGLSLLFITSPFAGILAGVLLLRWQNRRDTARTR